MSGSVEPFPEGSGAPAKDSASECYAGYNATRTWPLNPISTHAASSSMCRRFLSSSSRTLIHAHGYEVCGSSCANSGPLNRLKPTAIDDNWVFNQVLSV
jgi:hypothetical protein